MKSGEHEKPTPWANTCCPKVETKTYPHAIVYDFEAYQDTSKAVRPTSDLFYESEHVPISVSLADTLNPEPEYIVSRDPAELIRLFHQSLERRHTAIVADVVDKFPLPDIEGIPEKQGEEIVKWVYQVPVLGFNSGHYDLKLIRQHFIPLLAQDPGTFAAEKNGRIMFINTPKFKFLDVLNYLGPGITYEKWGQDLRCYPCQVLAPVRVVRQPGQAGLPRPASLHGLVLQAQGRVRANAEGVRRLPPHLQRAGHADLRRLAGVLQQPGRCPSWRHCRR